MSVNLSPVAGAAAQFLDNSGNVLTGGKLYTYLAGTTTPAATYTDSTGTTFHSNPIILDAAGRVPAGGEIWLSDNVSYKFVLKDANDVLLGTWDNLIGINSNFVNYSTQEEIQTATAGQTVFTLNTITYSPGTNSLSVFVDGVNQYDGVTYAYVETDANTVTFTAGLHAGALVKFTTAVSLTGNATNAALVVYDPPFTGGVSTTVEDKLAQSISIKDFGAIGDGITNDTAAWKAFVNYLVANGGAGYLNPGTYLVDSWSPNLIGNKPFEIFGAGKDISVLKNRTPNNSFFYTSNGNYITLSDFTINGDYSGTPAAASSGGNLVFVNSSDITIRNIKFIKFRRVAIMVFNDHQTTLTNVYRNIVIDGCEIYGNSDYDGYVGPSAMILADLNDSSISNCYIENIGLYGYEFKNDCYNTLITNCVAKNVYFPFYYGGDGVHTELGYVKNSVISNCMATGYREGFACGYASNNVITDIVFDNTNSVTAWTRYYTIDVRTSSNNNTFKNITAINPNWTLTTIRDNCVDNYIEFPNIFYNGTNTYRGVDGLTSNCSGNTVIFGNRDNTYSMSIDSTNVYNNTIIDKKLNTSTLNSAGSQLVKTRVGGSIGVDSLFSTAKGVAWVGDTMDEFYITNQTNQYKYIGNFTKPNIVSERNRLDIGSRILYVYDVASGTTEAWTWQKDSYFPETDGGVRLGNASRRWSTVYATTGTINTSDGREKQQIRELSAKEHAVAVKLKSSIRAFKFNDAVNTKNDTARIHFGVIAQDVKAAFESEGLVAENYGMFCYDEWLEEQEVKDNEGNVIQKYRPAGNRFGVRYDELLAFIIGAL